MKIQKNYFTHLKSAFSIILVFILVSCHKNLDIQISNPPQDLSNRVSEWFRTIKAAANKAVSENSEISSSNSKSTSGLNNLNTNNNAAILHTIENLNLLEDNLLYEKAIFSEYGKKYILIVIPINDYVKNKKNIAGEASLNLALITDKTGKFLSGNIMCFLPSDKKERYNFSPTVIADFLKGKPVNENGKIRVLNLTGRWLREFDLKDGKIISSGEIQSKNPEGKKITNSNCIDWYIVTTYHYPNGTTYQTSEYVGTTCEGCDNSDYQSLCPIGTGGNGGGSLPAPEIETDDDQASENVDGSGDGGPSPSEYLLPPCTVRYKFIKYFESDYWGLVWELVYVNVVNAEIVTPFLTFGTSDGFPGLAHITANNHDNSAVITGLITCMVTWTYNMNVGIQIDDPFLTNAYYTLAKRHARVG